MTLLSLKYRHFRLLTLFFLLSFYISTAQVPVTYLGINEGLSNNSVRCILKDHKGFMWFGTYDGLNRYDGYTFRVFRNKLNDTISLAHPVVYALGEDRSGNLWVGTRQGLSIYNSLTETFRQLTYQASQKDTPRQISDVVRTIGTDSRNNVFVGTENMGLLYCKDAAPVAAQVPLHADGSITTSFSVQSIKIGTGDKVWVFVQNKGLCLLDYASLALKLVSPDVKFASSLAIDGDKVWIGTVNGVYQYTAATGCVKMLDTQNGMLSSNNVTTLALDKDNNLWIGTFGGGVNTWNRSTGKVEQLQAGDSKYSLSAFDVYAIFEDKESRKWIGTLKGGINIIDPQKKRFQIIAHDPGIVNGFSGNSASAFYESPDSVLWIGTDDGGVNIWDRDKNTFTNLRYHPGQDNSSAFNSVSAINGDEGYTWIGSFTSGIVRVGKDLRSFKRYQCINPVSGAEDPVVFVLYRDSSKTLWAATLRRGNRYAALYYYNKTTDRFDAFDTRLSDMFTLNEDRQGNFWGGNLSQLVKIDRAGKNHQFYNIGHAVRAVHEDRKGNFWVATEGSGLILFDRAQRKIVARYTTGEGLCNNSVLTIHEDPSGNLWMSTLNGLSSFNPTGKSFKNYYYSDGLQSNQFNYNASLALRSGELVFGGIKGFNLFRPEQVHAANNIPPIAITSIKINNNFTVFNSPFVVKSTEDRVQQLRIPYDQAVLAFDFAALEYSVPEKIQYAYYLDGWDRNWNYSGKLRTANYTHLTEGTYTFRVKSTNGEGVWNGHEVAIRIIVLPPWYRSWWAYMGYAIVLGALIYILWLYRARQTRLKYEIAIANINVEKEKIEKEKHQAEYEKEKAVHDAERVINEKEKELNTKRLDFFTNITHEFRTPLTLIINPAKDLLQNGSSGTDAKSNNELAIIYRNARRMLSLVDQLLFFRKADIGIDKVKPAKLNFYSLCHEVYLCFVQQAKARNIQYEFEGNNEQLQLWVDREKMEIVLFNLLSNAIKYTPDNGKITFSIAEKEEQVEVTVSDTGTGIPPEVGDKLFDKFYKAEGKAAKPGFGIGLYLVKQFAGAHMGEVSYTSTPGKGTCFCLQLKKGSDHFDPSVISEEPATEPVFLHELISREEEQTEKNIDVVKGDKLQPIVTGKQTLLVVDDDPEIRQYIAGIFSDQFTVYEADNGKRGLEMAEKHFPDIIISDIKMEEGDGIAFCKEIKNHASLSHIPVILLTGTQSPELKLEGVEGGADDYITKPFEKELLKARVLNLQKNKANLQKYFFNEVTLHKQDLKISEEYKEFLEKCIAIVEAHLDDDEFTIVQLAAEMGKSYSYVYKKIRQISGQSLKGFVRFIRLRKAAELFINSNYNVSEVAFQVGIYDAKFFREQFNKVFGMNPSEYIKKYRKPFQGQYTINPDSNK
jgi:signal transduction histidine kinase/ligand-binding sensor domain-containing protein/DNA-binding response OmpR family regulator